jgi:hypothetical protein
VNTAVRSGVNKMWGNSRRAEGGLTSQKLIIPTYVVTSVSTNVLLYVDYITGSLERKWKRIMNTVSSL